MEMQKPTTDEDKMLLGALELKRKIILDMIRRPDCLPILVVLQDGMVGTNIHSIKPSKGEYQEFGREVMQLIQKYFPSHPSVTSN